MSDRLEGWVEDVSHDGSGVVKIEGKVYFVDGALPGESIRFMAKKRRRGKFQGYLLDVLSPSQDRVEPKCRYFGVCGGCSYQHVSTASQLQTKQKTLFNSLEKLGNVTPRETLSAIRSGSWHYRRKARLGIRYVPKKGGILVGFRERRSSYITSLQVCHTLEPRLSALLPSLHTLCSQLSNYHRLPQIEVAAADNAVALVLRCLQPFSDQDMKCLKNYAEQRRVQLFAQPGGVDSVVPVWPEQPETLHYRLDEFGLTMQFDPLDFIQINGIANERMITEVTQHLAPQADDRILDLFCGLGNFTLPLATSGALVTGVEGESALVNRGLENAAVNALPNARFEKVNLNDENLDHVFQGRHFNKILLDPPRSGALQVVKQLVPSVQPDECLYASCNPATLARDAGIMVHVNGYRLDKVGVIDMFPHTTHVESLALFSRRQS